MRPSYSLDNNLIVDAVAEMSLQSEMDTVTHEGADCWATVDQLLRYLHLDGRESLGWALTAAEEASLIETVEGAGARRPTGNGWALWQERNERTENPSRMNYRARC